jgi:multidrug transporter EmrE-like cation transporter
MKAAEFIKSKGFLTGLLLYVSGALIWMVILRLMPLSLAFPIAAGVLVIGTMLTGVLLLGEIVTTWQLAGSVMIMIGIALMGIGK